MFVTGRALNGGLRLLLVALVVGAVALVISAAASASDAVDQQPELGPATAVSESEMLARQQAREDQAREDAGLEDQEVSPAGGGCGSGKACMWFRVGFEGNRRVVQGSLGGLGWLDWTDGWSWKSAKNRFGNRKFVNRAFPGDPQKRCMDPGESRPNMPIMFELKVGVMGSRCS